MNYLKFGKSDKLILFLHGWGADLKSFLFVKEYFANYTKVFIDFAGFGKSVEPEKPFFVDDYVNQTYTLIKQFGVKELVLVGHSFGGRVAIKFAEKYQFDFEKLKICLVDSAGIRPRLTLRKKLKILAYKKLKHKAERNEKLKIKLLKYGSDDYKKLSAIMKQTFVNVVNEDLSNSAKNIRCDAILIWGSKDKDTKLCMARKLKKYIKNSKLYILKNAGHFSFLEKQQEFLIILDTFLKNK